MSQWTYGLWLNESGRILADSYVYAQADNSCLVWSFFCPAELLLETLQRNLVADQVELTDLSSDFEFSLVHVSEDDTGAVLCAKLSEFLGCDHPCNRTVVSKDECFVMGGSPLSEKDILIIGEPDFHNRLKENQLSTPVESITGKAFERARIKAGVPAIPADLNHRNLPQEGKFHTAVIDYQKGCFPGQEIMAKFRKGGKLNKQIQVFEFESEIPELETPLEVLSGKSVVGNITSLAREGETYVGLGLLRERAVEKPLHIRAISGTEYAIRVLK